MKYIFLDSNILIHFQSIEQIDWLKIANCKSCVLLIAPIVIDELESKKISNKKSSRRINKILAKIEEYSTEGQNEIRKNIFVEILVNKPTQLTYEKFGLNFQEQDHRLFATILEYKILRNENIILLISDDIGNRIRAKHYGINAIKLPVEYKLPDEPDPMEVKVRELEKENLKLKLKVQKPVIVFGNEEKYFEYDINIEEIELDSFIEDKMVEIIGKYPHLKYKIPDSNLNNLFNLSGLDILNEISKEQIDDYNENLDRFFKNYKEFLIDVFGYIKRENLSITLKFFLMNNGNTPAEDIDIYFHFPDGFELFNYNEFQEHLKEPVPPSKPKSQFESLHTSIFQPHDFLNAVPQAPNIDFHSNKPSIKKTNSYKVHYQFDTIKHFHKTELEKLVALFSSFDEMKNFNIQYKITAANIPDITEGNLNIKINKVNIDSSE